MTSTQLKICVIGAAGYIGLPLSCFLANSGYQVIGVDINEEKIKKLSQGICTLQEKNFSEVFEKAWSTKRITFKLTPDYADVFIIAVPTPLDKQNTKADLSFVNSALKSILPFLRKGNLIILESTVPPLTCQTLIKPVIEKNTTFKVPEDILVAHCPERAFPGNLVQEFIHNDRIIGGMNKKSAEMAAEIYKSFVKGKLLLTDDVTAETVKLAENTYRDINIAYANELKMICEQIGVNVDTVINLANLHPRVNILNPGIGVGGHCIPIDPWFLWQVAPNVSTLIPTAREINEKMVYYIVNHLSGKIQKLIEQTNQIPNVLLVGKAYKPNVEDTRESPALKIISLLKKRFSSDIVKFESVDPLVDNINPFSLKEYAKDKDLLVILVAHHPIVKEMEAYRQEILKVMRTPNIIVL